ncbi:hypothetical protein JK358_09160 [Nocardia sp. 2]|uniref:TPR repeat domain-containing protein n=1 Tax=Nocardia acididurans TaxID=2802282 RepID=A0ABS1M3D7_9NOCA|nr:hypothetical protein [Nocardia acididurans]MBL1074565.1 hypothetical protein [Nocardia acididurans]
MKGALHAAGVAAQGVTDGVTNAFARLPEAAQGAVPGSLTDPGIAKQQGIDDGQLVANGKATDADLQRITTRLAAAGITTADVEAINAGKQVELTEAQWNYLHAFYNTADLDGLTSMTDRLTTAGDTTAASTVVNQLNTLANPNVRSAGPDPLFGSNFHPQGGLTQLPTDLRNTLTKGYEVHQGRPYANLGAQDLLQVTQLMAQADGGSAPGSDINKALLVQAAEIAPQLDPSSPNVAIGVDYRLGSAEGLLQSMIAVGGEDRIAVHDILTGTNLHSDISKEQILDAFTQHHWPDDGAQVKQMLSWIGTDATSADVHIATRAGEAATTLAKYVGANGSDLLHLDGGRSPSLGEINPEIVKGIGSALSPYIPELVGVPDEYLETRGFDAPDDAESTQLDAPGRPAAQNIFAVIDTNVEAAREFNAQALLTAQQLNTLWLESVLADPTNPETDLATRSGTLFGLVDKGLDIEIAAQKDTEIGKAINGFVDKGSAYDSFKTAIGTGVKYIPVAKDIFGPMIDASNSYAKANIVGYSYDVPSTPDKPFDTSHDSTSARQLYQIAQALQGHDGTLAHDPRYDALFDSNGNLKSYEDAARSAGDQAGLHGKLQNILYSYQGGILREPLQDMAINVNNGRTAVTK